MEKEKPYLSIVIPCFDEEKNIRLGALTKVSDYLKNRRYSWEVLIVDDGSSDKSARLIEEFIKTHSGFKLIKNPHQGKAGTVISGINKSNGKFILFTDLDQATPLSEIKNFLPWLNQGFNIVIGSRREKREGAPFIRSLMGPGFAFIRSALIGLNDIKDTQCGFKAFENKSAKKLFSKMKLYGSSKKAKGPNVTSGFDVEMLFMANKLGYTIKEIPVKWHYVETRKVNPIIDSWNGLVDILRIKLLDFKGEYK
jgi:dolichyl-phosphate beta-glucosyltransferase